MLKISDVIEVISSPLKFCLIAPSIAARGDCSLEVYGLVCFVYAVSFKYVLFEALLLDITTDHYTF